MTAEEKEVLRYIAAGAVAAAVMLLMLTIVHRELLMPGVVRFDATVQGWVHGLASPWLTLLMRGATLIGSAVTIYPICALLALGLWSQALRREAALLFGSVLLADFTMNMMKHVFKRPRPHVPWGMVKEHTFSFPSGHATMSVVVYGMLLFLLLPMIETRWKRVLMCVAAAFLVAGIGLSRIYLGAHFPSDVAAGYLCGLIWVAAMVIVTRLAPQV